MDYQALADLWHQIMITAPYEDNRLGQWLRNDTPTDLLPQPGYVGRNYKPCGTLLLAQNPGKFRGTNKDAEDDPFYAALANMKEDRPNRLSAFYHLNQSFEEAAPAWPYYANVLKPVLDALKLSLPDVAYLNLIKWRSKGRVKQLLYDLSWEYTCRQIRELDPSFIVVLGKGARSAFDALYCGSAEREVVPRTRGDRYKSQEIRDARERLRLRAKSV